MTQHIGLIVPEQSKIFTEGNTPLDITALGVSLPPTSILGISSSPNVPTPLQQLGVDSQQLYFKKDKEQKTKH